MAGPAAFVEHFRAGGDVPPVAADAIFKDIAHPPPPLFDKIRHRVCQGRTDQAPWVLKLSATDALATPKCDFRFTLVSGRRQTSRSGPKSANRRHTAVGL